ncbi:hypothetical protein [Halostagnicola sp. A56]|uniref:hypothetical protein n=1 Tax=Halostagnicola sp. A56 TaxID=1495067 RepID=UPI0012E16DF2|nr:hypothetical protein [Halostagnicola sp. A56]
MTGTEEQNGAVLIINNLTKHSMMIEYIVRGEENSILHDGQTTIKAGKGFRSQTFPDEARAVEYQYHSNIAACCIWPIIYLYWPEKAIIDWIHTLNKRIRHGDLVPILIHI